MGMRRTGRLIIAGVAMWLGAASTAQAVVPSGPASTWVPDGEVAAVVAAGDTAWIGGNFRRIGPYTGSSARLLASTGELQSGAWPAVEGEVDAVTPDGTGGWFLGGRFTAVDGQPRTNLAHVLADGSVDPSWVPTTDGRVKALQRSGDHLFLGGEFAQVNGAPHAMLAELDQTGALTAFAGGLAFNGTPVDPVGVYDLALGGGAFSPTLYVVGEFDTAVSGNGSFTRKRGAAFLLSNGDVTAWNPDADRLINGLAGFSTVAGLGPNSFFLSGRFRKLNQAAGVQERFAMAHVNDGDGAVSAWVTPPASLGSDTAAVAVLGTSVYFAGALQIGPSDNRAAAAYNTATGAHRTAWQPAVSNVRTLAAAGGRIYLGSPSKRFINGVDATTGAAQFEQQLGGGGARAFGVSGGDLVVAGAFTTVGGVERHNLAAIDLATGRPTAFAPPMNGPAANVSRVNALALADDGLLWAGGGFDTEAPNVRTNLAAFDPVSGALASFRHSPNLEVRALAAVGTTVYVGGDFNQFDGVVRRHRAAAVFHVPGREGNITPYDPDVDGPVHAIAARGNTVYLGGQFTRVNQATASDADRASLAAVDGTTGLPLPWNPGADGTVRSLALVGSTVYAGGDFGAVGGGAVGRSRLAAFDAEGVGTPLPWNPGADASVRVLKPYGASLLVGGAFATAGGGSHPRLASIDLLTGTADAFGLDSATNALVPFSTGPVVQALAVAGGPRLVTGGAFLTHSPRPLLANLSIHALPELPAAPVGAPGPAQATTGEPARDTVAPRLDAFAASPKRFRVGPGRTAATGLATAARAAKPAPRGTALTLTLSEAASVRLELLKPAVGRRVGKACKPVTRKNRSRKRCTLLVARGTFARTAPVGKSRIAWSGRSGKKPLPPGRYTVRATPTDAAGNTGAPRTTAITIVRR